MTVTPDRTARAARAGQALMSRHAELQEVLDQWAGVLAAAADSGGPVRPARNLLRAFVDNEVLPHVRAEERTLYRAARRDPRTSLLVQALISEHRDLAARAAASRQDFQAALRFIATGPPRQMSFPGQEKKEDDHHAYHR